MPQLAPDVLYDIFRIVTKENSASSLVNLLACALTCRLWYICAVDSIISNPSLSSLRLHTYPKSDLERLAIIFTDSRKYRLSLGDLINEVNVSLKRDMFFGKDSFYERDAKIMVQVVKSLSSLQGKRLNIDLNGVHSRAQLEKTQNFFNDLFLAAHHITDLSIRNLRPPQMPSDTITPLAQLIRASSSTLECITLVAYQTDPSELQALSTATGIHTAVFDWTFFPPIPEPLPNLLSSWPNLRSLTIRCRNVHPHSIITTLYTFSPPLQELHLQFISGQPEFELFTQLVPEDADDLAPALIALLTAVAPSLIRLGLHDFLCLTDTTFLAPLARIPFQELLYLDLTGCVNIIGNFMPQEWNSPLLRSLRISGCTDFIPIPITLCPDLRTIQVSLGFKVSKSLYHTLWAMGFTSFPMQEPGNMLWVKGDWEAELQ